MGSKKIITSLVIAVAVLGIILGVWIFGESKGNLSNMSDVVNPPRKTVQKSESQPAAKSNLPEATGNAVSIAGGIASQMQTEEDKFSAEDNESASLGADGDTLNDLGQSYDSNEF
jgi:hypothetical protein